MNKINKIVIASLLGSSLTFSGVSARSIETPDGGMPLVHWATLQSTPGNMGEMITLGAKNVAPAVAEETGTYALYGGIDIENGDIMRLLEIYEDQEAYQKHITSDGFASYEKARKPILKKLVLLEAIPLVLAQKRTGVATCVIMERIVLKDDKAFQRYLKTVTKEAKRAVEEETGVLGVFSTTEEKDPLVVRNLYLFKDKDAYVSWKASPRAKSYFDMVKRSSTANDIIENQTTAIPLTQKGVAVKK